MAQNGRGAINPRTQAQAASFFNKVQSLADPQNIAQVQTRDGGIAGQFPIQLGTADQDDVRMSIKAQAIRPDGTVPNMGMAIATDSDFAYLERKKEDVMQAQFKAWVNANADLGDPANAAWYIERFPWLIESRMEEIERVSELQKRLAKINLTGPQTEDDFILMWSIIQGTVSVPEKPLQNLWEDDARYKKDFTKGFFSPLSQGPNKTAGAVGMPLAINDRKIPSWKNALKDIKSNTGATVAQPTMPASYASLFPGPGRLQ